MTLKDFIVACVPVQKQFLVNSLMLVMESEPPENSGFRNMYVARSAKCSKNQWVLLC